MCFGIDLSSTIVSVRRCVRFLVVMTLVARLANVTFAVLLCLMALMWIVATGWRADLR